MKQTAIPSRLSDLFGLQVPIILAPMAYAAGGALVSACARAGALALVGGGYGELDWLQREFALATSTGPRERIGCGFITWKLADGVLMGSRFWATQECLAPAAAKEVAARANGDSTARSPVFDILRQKNWPAPYDFRVIRNELHRAWEDRIDALRQSPDAVRADFEAGVQALDYARANVTVGEAVGLINDHPPAEQLIARLKDDYEKQIERLGAWAS